MGCTVSQELVRHGQLVLVPTKFLADNHGNDKLVHWYCNDHPQGEGPEGPVVPLLLLVYALHLEGEVEVFGVSPLSRDLPHLAVAWLSGPQAIGAPWRLVRPWIHQPYYWIPSSGSTVFNMWVPKVYSQQAWRTLGEKWRRLESKT